MRGCLWRCRAGWWFGCGGYALSSSSGRLVKSSFPIGCAPSGWRGTYFQAQLPMRGCPLTHGPAARSKPARTNWVGAVVLMATADDLVPLVPPVPGCGTSGGEFGVVFSSLIVPARFSRNRTVAHPARGTVGVAYPSCAEAPPRARSNVMVCERCFWGICTLKC